MTAVLIPFPEAPKGNGAREVMIDIALTFKNTSKDDAAMWSDYMLMEFWVRGFKVVPVES